MKHKERPWKTVSWATWQKMLRWAHALDLNKNGLYDARGGAINVWASPQDKPPGWEKVEITQGALDYPRELVGTIMLDHTGLRSEGEVRLALEVDPVARVLVERGLPARKRFDHLGEKPTTAEWGWMKEKAQTLLGIAERELDPPAGIYCKLCDRRVEVTLLNDFLSHLRVEHRVRILSLVMGDPTYINTSIGRIVLT